MMKKYLAITIVIVLAVGAGAFLYMHGGTGALVAKTEDKTPPPNYHRTPPSGDSEYFDNEYHFSLLAPKDFIPNKRGESGGAATVVFQDVKTTQGFQVYITPYAEQTVSDEQFKKDESSGIKNDPKNVTIDGVSAVSFYGHDTTLGDTAEIWFIHDGYLYEVTTLKSLAPWLSGIMQTWKFLPSTQ